MIEPRAHRAALVAAVVSLLASMLLALAAPAAARAAGPRLSARAAVLVAPATGQELYGLQARRELPIASTTKLMTALVTLEHARLDKMFAAPTYYLSPAASQIGLASGERMTVHDLLLALLLPSADDAAEDLAYNVGGRSVGRFVAMMNRRARRLGLRHTHYSTPIGFDTAGNYSTASDLVKLAAYLLRAEPFAARAVGLRSAVLRSGNHVRLIINRNDLVGRYPWIHGVKTGHTLGAGYVLVASARRSGMTLLSAVLGTASEQARDANTMALLNYGYSSFRLLTPVRRGAVLARPTVKDRAGTRAAVIAATSFTRVVPRNVRVTLHVIVPRQLVGPLARHAVVGSVAVLAGGQRIGRVPLLLAQRLPPVSALSRAAHFATRPSTVVSLLVLFGVAIVLAARRRERARGKGERRAEAA